MKHVTLSQIDKRNCVGRTAVPLAIPFSSTRNQDLPLELPKDEAIIHRRRDLDPRFVTTIDMRQSDGAETLGNLYIWTVAPRFQRLVSSTLRRCDDEGFPIIRHLESPTPGRYQITSTAAVRRRLS